MDGFSYTNIFETKGIEYLIIITFLLLIIPFWIVINRKKGINKKVSDALGRLTGDILNIPLGLFYSKYHIWAYLEKSGFARVGLDDFLQHITGEVKVGCLKDPGYIIQKGELLACLEQNGKLLHIHSPLSGVVMNTNTALYKSPGVINEDPYGRGWLYKIKPSEWKADTGSCLLAEEAVDWSKSEIERFRDFLATSLPKYSPENSLVMLQDGGELCDRPLADLPAEVWNDFQDSFLK